MNFQDLDHAEFFVADAPAAAQHFRDRYGFRTVAHAGPETGLPGRRCLLLTHGKIKLVLTQALTPSDPVAQYVAHHGDGIRDLAIRVRDAKAAFEEAVSRGATPIEGPRAFEDRNGRLISATVASPVGDVVHSFIQRDAPDVFFWPGRFEAVVEDAPVLTHDLLTTIDHVAMCIPTGQLEQTVAAYERIFGLHTSHEENVATQYGGMNSKVVQDATGRVCFPLMEPMPGKPPGQIDHFLKNHRGAGVQHLAMLTEDLIDAVRHLHGRKVAFLPAPPRYYERMPERVGVIDEDIETMRAHNVLVDREGTGYLLQVFTRSEHERKTLFFEVIQRKAARGFGGANVRALYEAVEQAITPSVVSAA